MDAFQKAIQVDLAMEIEAHALGCAYDVKNELHFDAVGRQAFGKLLGLIQAYHILNGNGVDICFVHQRAQEAIGAQLALIEGAA